MDKPDYAYEVFTLHYGCAAFGRKERKFVATEFCPRDSALSAVIARAYGTTSSYLVDVESFAMGELLPLSEDCEDINEPRFEFATNERAPSLDDVLTIRGAHYLVSDSESLRVLPSASVDFISSHTGRVRARAENAFLPRLRNCVGLFGQTAYPIYAPP
jgi:hypothetical protein